MGYPGIVKRHFFRQAVPVFRIPAGMMRDLMKENKVTEWDIQEVVAARGYYPSDTPVEKYDAGAGSFSLPGCLPRSKLSTVKL